MTITRINKQFWLLVMTMVGGFGRVKIANGLRSTFFFYNQDFAIHSAPLQPLADLVNVFRARTALPNDLVKLTSPFDCPIKTPFTSVTSKTD